MVQIINKTSIEKLTENIDNLNIEYTSVYLIGSRVWGYFSEKSDYDIMIETKNYEKITNIPIFKTIGESRFDIKIGTSETIFNKVNGMFELPKYNIVTKEIQCVNINDIIDWVHYRLENHIYQFRHSSLKQWHYDSFGISDKINLPS